MLHEGFFLCTSKNIQLTDIKPLFIRTYVPINLLIRVTNVLFADKRTRYAKLEQYSRNSLENR